MILSGGAQVEFRSSERSRLDIVSRVYKHRTPNGVKPPSNHGHSKLAGTGSAFLTCEVMRLSGSS